MTPKTYLKISWDYPFNTTWIRCLIILTRIGLLPLTRITKYLFCRVNLLWRNFLISYLYCTVFNTRIIFFAARKLRRGQPSLITATWTIPASQAITSHCQTLFSVRYFSSNQQKQLHGLYFTFSNAITSHFQIISVQGRLAEPFYSYLHGLYLITTHLSAR
jgi:hypothetical protein